MNHFFWAFGLGALSAISLPLGSWIGLRFSFSSRTISVLAAFGAGALLAALTVELVAPATLALAVVDPADRAGSRGYFFALVAGCVIGGVVYVLLDKAVNSRGGFLRRPSTLYQYYRRLNRREKQSVIEKLSAVPLFRNFPAEHIDTLLAALEPASFDDGEVIVTEGQPADAAFLVVKGEIEGTLHAAKFPETASKYALVNLVPMLTGTPALGTGIARGDTTCMRISRKSFDELRKLSPEFDSACRQLTVDRLETLKQMVTAEHQQVSDWLRSAAQSLAADRAVPAVPELRRMKKEHHGAPLAIWLGMMLDGIPESLVIGAGMLALVSSTVAASGSVSFGDVIPYTLIAGLFLSNFPEALSSSANMLAQGFSKSRIMLLWFTLLLVTAVGAGIGYLLADVLDHTWMALFEGMAAGAMLTMIASAMIPEAVILGTGTTVGLSTLAGFLAAVLFKLLEV